MVKAGIFLTFAINMSRISPRQKGFVMSSIELGKKQKLTVLRKTDFGVYLGTEGDAEQS